MKELKGYELKALLFAEENGIIDYDVIGNTMVFYEKWVMEHREMKCMLNLDTMKETREVFRTW